MPSNMSKELNRCKCGRTIPKRGNSTIQPKLCPKCAYEKAIRSSGKSKSATFSRKTGKVSPKGEIMPKNALHTKTNWMEVADKWFSRWIRLRDCGVDDGVAYTTDIITNKFYSCKSLDCGHYYSRYFPGTRYDENNCWPQNRSSNRFRGEADKDKFKENIIRRIGQDEFDLIGKRKNDPLPGTYKEIAEEYRRKVNELVKKRGIQKWW